MNKHCVNHKNKDVVDLANSLGIHPAIAASKIAIWQEKNGLDKFPTNSDLVKQQEINYNLKATNILLSDKAKQIFEKGKKANWDLNKILTELQIPKEQRQIILDKNITNREEIITSLLADNSFVVEINTASKLVPNQNITSDYNENPLIEIKDGKAYEISPRGELIKRPDILVEPKKDYINLTVPGGTNYTNNEISTPLITPSIKGHAQFATSNGIGWFRSDDKIEFLDKEDLIRKGIIKQVPCG